MVLMRRACNLRAYTQRDGVPVLWDGTDSRRSRRLECHSQRVRFLLFPIDNRGSRFLGDLVPLRAIPAPESI